MEIWHYPNQLASLEKNLTIGEQYHLSRWWDNIQDRDSVAHFLNLMADFIDERVAELVERFGDDKSYAALFAIGSSTKGKEHNDIDFLLVTNQIYRDLESYNPNNVLQRDFNYSVNMTMPEAYRRRPIGGDRVLINLDPKEFKGRTIQLTLQPEVEYLEDWLHTDKEERVLVYKSNSRS